MTTNPTQQANSSPVLPASSASSSDGSQYDAYMMGMAYVLQVLMEVGARNDSIMDMDQQINAKKEMEEVVLNGAHDHFQSAGDMASYFNYIAEHAASFGLSNDVASWAQTQAESIASATDTSKLNSDVKTYIFDQEVDNGMLKQLDPNAYAMSPHFHPTASNRDTQEFNTYLEGVNAHLKQVMNSSDIFDKGDQAGDLVRQGNDEALSQYGKLFQNLVDSVPSSNSNS
ncbi:MAG: hypothetical protein KBC64_01980 [Simkaniaceae bacterium]|nr:hypothetical protein [Simkaniaceae bacterium]